MAFLISLTTNRDLQLRHLYRCRSSSARAPSASMSLRRMVSQTPMRPHQLTSSCRACFTFHGSRTPPRTCSTKMPSAMWSSCGKDPAANVGEILAPSEGSYRMTFKIASANYTGSLGAARPSLQLHASVGLGAAFGNTYHAARNLFERFRGVLELIRRFEFEFCRCGNYFFEGFEFLVRSCECAVACLSPRTSISNVVASLTIDDNIYIYIYVRCIYICKRCSKKT